MGEPKEPGRAPIPNQPPGQDSLEVPPGMLKEVVKKAVVDRDLRMTGPEHPLFALLPEKAEQFQREWFNTVGKMVEGQFAPSFLELDAAGSQHDDAFLEKLGEAVGALRECDSFGGQPPPEFQELEALVQGRTEAFPKKLEESLAFLREGGFFGLGVPGEHGGLCDEDTPPSLSTVTANMLLAQGDPGLMITSAVSGGLGCGCLLYALRQAERESKGDPDDATLKFIQAQVEKWVPQIASGEVIVGYGLTEPDVGSDAAAIQTRAVKGKSYKVGETETEFVAEGGDRPDNALDDGVDGYRVTGTKQFITNGPLAGMVLVFAKTGPEEERGKNIGLFIVEKDEEGRSGFKVGRVEEKTGLTSSTTSQIILEDVFVPAENLVGGPAWERRGFETAMGTLESGRLNVASQATGVSRRALEETVRYANQRIQFGGSLHQRKGVENELWQMEATVEAQTALVYLNALAKDKGVCSNAMASRAKLFCTDSAQGITQTAVQLHGGYGFSREFVVEALNRAAGVFSIYEGANEVNALVSAKELIETGNYPRLADFGINEDVLRAKGLTQSVSELNKVEELIDETLGNKGGLDDVQKIALSRIAATGDAMRALLISASQKEGDTGGLEDNAHLFCTKVALKMVDRFKHDLSPPTERVVTAADG